MADTSNADRTYTVKTVCNRDVAGLVERIDEVIYEVSKSQSEGLANVRVADRARLDQYNGRLERYVGWLTSEPEVDAPESHPSECNITYISETEDDDCENKALRDLIRMYRVLMTEMANSQSTRMPNGLSRYDKARFDSHLRKIRSFLTGFVDQELPVDLPESSPSSASTSHGF